MRFTEGLGEGQQGILVVLELLESSLPFAEFGLVDNLDVNLYSGFILFVIDDEFGIIVPRVIHLRFLFLGFVSLVLVGFATLGSLEGWSHFI